MHSKISIRGGTSHGSARILARAGRARAGSARSSSGKSYLDLSRLARAREILIWLWLGSLGLGVVKWLGSARLTSQRTSQNQAKFWLVLARTCNKMEHDLN